MIEVKDVYTTQEHIDGLEFNVDTVYVKQNIRKKEIFDEEGKKVRELWVYDEIQYTYDEYVVILNSKVEKSNIEQEALILDNAYRVAVLEISTGATLNI